MPRTEETVRYIFIGDIHGDIVWLNRIENEFSDQLETGGTKLVSVGDLVDSFTHDLTEQLQVVRKMVNLVEAGVAICTLSNHDLQYMKSHPLNGKGYDTCSGYKGVTLMALAPDLEPKMSKLWVPYFYLESPHRILVTHAGLSLDFVLTNEFPELAGFEMGPGWMDEVREGVGAYDYVMKKAWDEWATGTERGPYRSFGAVGVSRGGMGDCGGPLWCDWQDEFKPIPGLRQVFGHSANFTRARKNQKQIGSLRCTLDEQNWNIDGRRQGSWVLIYDTETFQFTPHDMGLPANDRP